MKKRRSILALTLILVVFFLPSIFYKKEFPQRAVDSVVKVIAYHSDGDLRGVSYIYPIFYRLGLIEVPEKVKEVLWGKKRKRNASNVEIIYMSAKIK